MEVDFTPAGIKAVKGLITEDTTVVATINTATQRNQRFYFYLMHSVEPSLGKEIKVAIVN